MVLVNELLDQPGEKIQQIVTRLKQDQQKLKPEQIAVHAQEVLDTFHEMRDSLQPILHLFYGLDVGSISKLRISSEEEDEEKTEAVLSSNRLASSARHAVSKDENQSNVDLLTEQITREEEAQDNTAKAHNYKYEGVLLPSQMELMDTVWEWLNDKSVGTISIGGYSGMGKTWMARQLKNRAVASNIFDAVIWISSRDNLGEYQEPSVDQLQLSVTKKPDGKYYSKEDLIQKVLSLGRKSFLLIIDDFDKTHHLNDFGFPRRQEQNKLSKVLVTSYPVAKLVTYRLVTDKVRNVEDLTRDEAWLLFQGTTKLDIDSPVVHEIVKPLLRSYSNVPSAIVSDEGGVTNLTKEVYDLVKSGRKDVLECLQFCTCIPARDRVKVKELILCWIVRILNGSEFHYILELEKAYEKAYQILKELTDRQILKRTENHVWVNKLVPYLKLDFFTSGSVFLYENALAYLGETSYVMNENLRTKISDDVKEYSSNTEFLLLHGKDGCLPHEIPDLFFDKMQQLKTVAILHAEIVSLPESLSNLQNLRSLFIIGCRSLDNVDQIRGLRYLGSLSLSGASSLNELPDDIFQHIDYLAHLDLSNTQLKRLPSSFSKLSYLTVLVLRGCSHLDSIPPMERFRDLSLLDLSGAKALKSIPDIIYKLETLDLSGTLVDKLPSPPNLKFLVQLFLRGCSQIKAMPHPGAFCELRVLDLSGATAFREFQVESYESDSSLIKLDLSGTLAAEVSPLSRFLDLRELLLRNCCNIETMPPLGSVLEVLDLSGSSAFKNFQDESLGVQLRNLDVSNTHIEKLPMLSKNSVMVQLILKDCEFLEELPPLELPRLQVLDLSGSTKFKTFKDDSLEKLCRLKTLNLSETQVATLPTLSQCSDLRKIILRNCLTLETLPQVGALKRLELLDLSGAIAFKRFRDDSLGKMEDLQELNLSGTQVVQVPSLSECRNLHNLILGNCSKLEILPNLEALSALVVLDLSRAVSLTKFPTQSTGQRNYHLEVLNLSGTQVSDLSFLSGCINICQLFLRDCPNIQTLPPLDKLTRLEVFDISGSNIGDFSFLSGCNNLRQLSLRGCSDLEVLSFEGMHNLQKVDLSERPMKMLPSSFSGLKNVSTLLLKECLYLESLPRIESFTGLEVLDLSCTKVRDFPNGISALNHLRFLKLQDGNNLWEFHSAKSFENFHLCLFAPKERIGERDIYLQGLQYSFKDIYYQTSHIPRLTEEPEKFFKICGFETFPAGIEEVLTYVELLYLKKNIFLTRLSDLGAEKLKEMRECWIENCNSMESVFYGEEIEENMALGSNLQNLWVSKLSELKCLFRGVVQPGSFTLLKHLYIECCPSLITVFSSHLELKTLEVLKIKFCDKIASIFGEAVSGQKTLPNLKTLILLKLPELQSICEGVLRSIRNLRVIGCKKLKMLPVSVNRTGPHIKVKGEVVWWNDLEWEDSDTKSQLHFSPF
ncbi:Disease resistance protein [Thalictrum thalictroides]|uniref:Disease resistance protein n=1 Tax=Thalictrum thalictroides TaxID=46969 RepID=A0A7J6WPI6_THATH|nr:Disease resistance protein [Thalictrum thalictroides]